MSISAIAGAVLSDDEIRESRPSSHAPARGHAWNNLQRLLERMVVVRAVPEPQDIHDSLVGGVSGQTAWQALVTHGRLAARATRAHPRRGRQLGAYEVIDYGRERFEDRGGAHDLVFDQIGGNIKKRSRAVLNCGDRLITVTGEEADAPNQARARASGVTARFFIVESDVDELRRPTDLITARTVRPIVGRRFGSDSIAESFAARAVAGKAV